MGYYQETINSVTDKLIDLVPSASVYINSQIPKSDLPNVFFVVMVNSELLAADDKNHIPLLSFTVQFYSDDIIQHAVMLDTLYADGLLFDENYFYQYILDETIKPLTEFDLYGGW
ncbi:MAG: hypothetical protein LBT10_01860 [Methanobrevibacter sp.]|jgi:hypothetical protein|nr:hypothetical protein [Methanobrevibacter sp.]